MFYFAIFCALVSSVKSSIPWYPVMMPIHTGGHHHRHTTHIITHPIVQTRFFVLGDDDHHHHHQHNHGHNHLHQHGHKHAHHHKHGHQYLHQRSPSHNRQRIIYGGAIKYPQQKAGYSQKTYARHTYSQHGEYEHGGHDYGDDYQNRYNSKEPIKYSVPVEESPWKPIHHIKPVDHIPEGYLPLDHLGIDKERVAKVVKEAISEIEHDIENESDGKRGGNPTSFHRGAVYYDDDEPIIETDSEFFVNEGRSASKDRTFKLNIECQCQEPR